MAKNKVSNPKPNYICLQIRIDILRICKVFPFAARPCPSPSPHFPPLGDKERSTLGIVSAWEIEPHTLPLWADTFLKVAFFPPIHLVFKCGHHLFLHTSHSINILSCFTIVNAVIDTWVRLYARMVVVFFKFNRITQVCREKFNQIFSS